jgi:hypothetical protein
VIVLLGALLGLAVLALFVRLERRDRPEITVAVVVAIAFVEMLLYPDQNDVQAGLFRLAVGGQSLRPYDVLIPLALMARLWVRGVPRRWAPEGVAWAVFFTWYAVGLVIGLLHDNELALSLFHFRAVVNVGGGFVLAAGVPAQRYVRRRTVGVLVIALGLTAALYAGPTLASSDDTASPTDEATPGITFGQLGADTPTAMVSLGVVALLVEGARSSGRRTYVFVGSLGLLVVPFLVSQRAAIIGLATCIGLLFALSGTQTWRRRITTTPVEAALLLAAVAVPVIGMLVAQSISASGDPEQPELSIPLVERVNESFFATSKAASAETRKNLWSDGIDRIFDKPLVGSGLGTEYRVERAAVDDDLVGGGFHNIVVDVAVRSGLAGLAMFVIACTGSAAAAIRAWRRHPDPLVAALAMGVLVALAGLLAKGLVESVFEKYRLAVLAGVLLGVLGSASASERAAREEGAADRSRPTARFASRVGTSVEN